MKGLILIGLLCGALSVEAQQLPASPANAEFQSATQRPAAGNVAAGSPSAAKPPRPLRIIKSGLLVDLARSNYPAQMFSLRVPYRPKEEMENLSIEPRTGRIRGWILFALKF